MNVVGVIQARLHSTRLKEKILIDINGKPLIQHVWERCRQSQLLDELIIACDEEKVLDIVSGFGAKACLTSKDHVSGTDRIIEAVQNIDCGIVINIQGDEPLIQHSIIDDLAGALLNDEGCQMATVIKSIENPQEVGDPNVVKVVVDDNGHALYFSR